MCLVVDLEASRRLILEEIGAPPDLTLIRGRGNRGDDLIWAGTQEMLAEYIYREVGPESLCEANGHTALLCGGGAFCRPYYDFMPRVLAIAELRFERVIVLPSSFDPSEDEVRNALSRTRATVFAREPESYRRIQSLCDARLAHDCAFFFDFDPWRRTGQGTLNAFRGDHEAIGGHSIPAGNDDISITAPTLDEWLATIARHESLRTDRAHVMIAGALLGKRVEFTPSAYHKLEAIAESCLSDYPVTLAPAPARPRRRGGPPAAGSRTPTTQADSRVTAVVLSRDRPEHALQAIDSLSPSVVPLSALVIDNNSAPAAAAALAEGCAMREQVTLRRSDRNLGCAGGRLLAVDLVGTEYVLFIDDDAELAPGALDLLVAELDEHPDCSAVSATVMFPDGSVHHSGGRLTVSEGLASFSLIGHGEQGVDGLPGTGPAEWVPGTAALVRRAVFEEFPVDEQMAAHYANREWCYRVDRARPGSFRRSLEARAVHHFTPELWPPGDFHTRSRDVELLRVHARFYERHGVVPDTAFELVPELRDADGTPDVPAARILMELLLAKGPDWTLMEWMNGNLDGLLAGSRRLAAQADVSGHLARDLAEQREILPYLHERHATLERIEAGGWWGLRRRLLPALRAYWRLRGPEARG
jgi:glycosyltransferase involved in cell wall biosynthesis